MLGFILDCLCCFENYSDEVIQMDTFFQQFPIVFHALNVGFLQTLKLFAVTLLGAIPLGLIISFGSILGRR